MKEILKDIITLSNRMDSLGLHKEADMLDTVTKIVSELSKELGADGEKEDSDPKKDSDTDQSNEESGREIQYEGYSTKNFHMCSGAQKAFSKIIEKESSQLPKEDVLKAIEDTDSLLALEKKVLESESGASEEDVLESAKLARNISSCAGKISEAIDEDLKEDFDFLDMHVEKILDSYTKEE
ncbi:MAG: hypothetical protein CBE07_001545 [Pelagibacteraceae bacterium TMED247]|nr:MAG: hypothetical protein CBE07_001545 [Pelagibacteraceae bacterium TMED247]|tara:strand:+ start:2518 stop:3063 length:546 start_codon:yes stop_codon:yes gene_type:complete